ncbi:hypothetical protein I4U23_000258 [Adineta vaga]|nr:hypothetical protein I4U23_000258 [Adineta vaga]
MASSDNQNSETSAPSAPSKDSEQLRNTKCVTGFGFIKTKYGLLNILTLISLICILITAGIPDYGYAKVADQNSSASSVEISAVSTRNSIIAFAVLGLILMIIDTILYVFKLIYRLPTKFDLIFIIVMLIFSAIYFILACCAAAWAEKLNNTVYENDSVNHKGAAAAASFFLFVATGVILANFILRLVRPEIIQSKQ